MNLQEYLHLPVQKKFDFFMRTRAKTNRTASYWVNWDNVCNNMKEHELNLNTLNYLVGKSNIRQEAKNLFLKQPYLLKSVPIIFANRDSKFDVLEFTENNEMSFYPLDFNNPDLKQLDKYLNFLEKSGLFNFLQSNLKESLLDYVFGVQVGLDSNGRKNRGGIQNEKILQINLEKLVKDTKLQYLEQATAKKILEKWKIVVPESLDSKQTGGRRYDGAIYNPKTNKVTIVETNFYGGGGSKLKAVAGEFSSIYETSLRAAPNVDFVWISDGLGWDTAKNPMREAFDVIPNIFNLHMVDLGFLKNVAEF